MRARAVIGANFGDEGKGLMVDYLCATQGAGMVVRYNGGAQAGHTVVTPEGQRHVFRHFGSGSLVGVPTFLSQFFVCNPIVAIREAAELNQLGVSPVLYAHPSCLVTTFADMMINQFIELQRGKDRHGSVGVGVHETIERSRIPELVITMSDLWNQINLRSVLKQICGKYFEFRTRQPIPNADHVEQMTETFLKHCSLFASQVHPLGIQQCPDPIFEGAQGLLLDQDNKKFFPHVTHSNTGMKNVRVLCEQAGIKDIDKYYVSRTYMTRHGAGPFPTEVPGMQYEDNTNLDHQFQGKLRFGNLDFANLLNRCSIDGGNDFKLALTHCDQLDSRHGNFRSYGPTRANVLSRE